MKKAKPSKVERREDRETPDSRPPLLPKETLPLFVPVWEEEDH